MQKIIPHLWFDKQAKEAAEFYVSIFPNAKMGSVDVLKDTPGGDTELLTFQIMGFKFSAMSAGPLFKINPSISFMVNFDPSQVDSAEEKLQEVWSKLLEGGSVLMPLQEYPFSKKYGWVQDKYGVSWQLMLTDPQGEDRPLIIPCLLFVKEKSGMTKEARDFYLSVFKNSKAGTLAEFEEGTQFGQEKGDVMFSDFMIEGIWVSAMDGGDPHNFDFNEAVSLMIYCKDQKEIDYYWERLSAVPESEKCGWLKDKYGVSWQIVPEKLDELMSTGTEEQKQRVVQAFLKMKKFNLAELEKAYEGE